MILAEQSVKQILNSQPMNFDALHLLGVIKGAQGKLPESIQFLKKAITVNPNNNFVHFNLAKVLSDSGQDHESLIHHQRAIALAPNHSDAWLNYGRSLSFLKRDNEALAAYDKALSINSNLPGAWSNRGLALSNIKRYEEALASFDKAINIYPNFAGAWSNRGNALHDLRRHNESLTSFDKAISINPNQVDAWYNRGRALHELKRYDEALASYDRALSINGNYAEALANRGMTLYVLKCYDEALISFGKALAIKPQLPYVQGAWLLTRMRCCDWADIEAAYTRIDHAVSLGETASAPFAFLAVPSNPLHQQHCARTYVEDNYPVSPTPLWKGERYTHERIRVGYFSSDYKNHPVSHLIAQLIECHDRTRFEIIGFSFGPTTTDPWRQRLERAFDRFIDVRTQTDREIATLARELEIDIAIDLNGHTQDARTGIFALRPVPIQVNYLGYIGTMGADYIDYLIADQVVVPEEHRPYYSEKVVCLPHSYQVNDSTKAISDRHFSRAELGLPEDAFVFCCFNNAYKITPDLFDIWMRLLNAVNGSVLWLFEGYSTAATNLWLEAGKRGISPDRLVFAPRMELADYLARYRSADLFLDTFYYNAGTTASDALWAGLPVLTCMGDTFAGRMASSLLTAIGLPELITHSHAEYESLALKLATQPGQLAAIRQKLVENITTHPLFDTERFTRHIEEAYLKMYERYQAGLPPDHVAVDA
jgi:predicted O-linked N-acetylglucosamine transferase (SPINDLY family)